MSLRKENVMADYGRVTEPEEVAGGEFPGAWPTVSVVIPLLNEERYVEACVRAVLTQNYPRERIEVLVVDGPSTDRTREIVRALARADGRIRLLSSALRCIPYSMNIGVAAANGEVVVRIDGHSVVGPEHVRRLVAYLARSGADHVGGVMRATGRTYIARTIALATSSPFGVGTARFRYATREQEIDTVAFGAYRRAALRRLGGFDERFPIGEDPELDYRIALNGGRVCVTPTVETEYYCRESLPRLAKQYVRYGRAKAAILHKHGALPSPRALAPALFVLFVGVLVIAAPLSAHARRTLANVLAAYGLGLLCAGLFTAWRRGPRYAPLLPVAFATLHLSHGLGFLSALPVFLTPRPSERRRGSLGPAHNQATGSTIVPAGLDLEVAL